LPAGFSFLPGLVRRAGSLPGFRFFRLFLLGKAPAARFAMETLILFLRRYWRGAFKTKNLVHRFSCREIVAGEPAFPVKWASIFVLAPV
jgi:hypothetical protein